MFKEARVIKGKQFVALWASDTPKTLELDSRNKILSFNTTVALIEALKFLKLLVQ